MAVAAVHPSAGSGSRQSLRSRACSRERAGAEADNGERRKRADELRQGDVLLGVDGRLTLVKSDAEPRECPPWSFAPHLGIDREWVSFDIGPVTTSEARFLVVPGSTVFVLAW